MANTSDRIIGWFSCGVTSAVACKLALQDYGNVEIVYIDAGGMHPDSYRFLHDCEKWFGRQIRIVRSDKYDSAIDVWRDRKYINGISGAPCTYWLKRKVRWKLEDEWGEWKGQVFGFDISEKKRAQRFREQNPKAKAVYPLIKHSLTKPECMALLRRHGIKIPEMYSLGFHNNNCIGCCKGNRGYWNLIRKRFPLMFNDVARLERELGHSCINGVFLDELDPKLIEKPIVEQCSLYCDVDFMDVEDNKLAHP